MMSDHFFILVILSLRSEVIIKNYGKESWEIDALGNYMFDLISQVADVIIYKNETGGELPKYV